MIIMNYMLCGRNKLSLELKPILLLIIAFVLVSCGNKGPLVLPSEPPQDITIEDSAEVSQLERVKIGTT